MERRGDTHKLTTQRSKLHTKDGIVRRWIFLDTLSCSGVLCLLKTHQMLLTDKVRNVTWRWKWNSIPLEYKCAALPLWIKIRTQNFNNYRTIDKPLYTSYLMTNQKMLKYCCFTPKTVMGSFSTLWWGSSLSWNTTQCSLVVSDY